MSGHGVTRRMQQEPRPMARRLGAVWQPEKNKKLAPLFRRERYAASVNTVRDLALSKKARRRNSRGRRLS